MTTLTEEKLIKNFARCSDWEERYLYLIELGNRFSTLTLAETNSDMLVKGCQSKVWLQLALEDGKFCLSGTSDTAIVKGMVSILIILVNGKAVEQVSIKHCQQVLAKIGLDESLTPVRNQGMAAMLSFIFNSNKG